MTESEGAPHVKRKPHLGWRTRLFMLATAVTVLLVSFNLSIQDRARVHVSIGSTKFLVPHSCQFRSATTVSCPGCGLTRSFCSMSHGEVAEAFVYNPLGPWSYAYFVMFTAALAISFVSDSFGDAFLNSKSMKQSLTVIFLCSLAIWPIRVLIELYGRY